MKRLLFDVFCIATIVACNKSAGPSHTETHSNRPVSGGEKNNPGCLSSAGERWSELKQDCIQVFNIGFRLNPIEPASGQTVISAFVIFSDDLSRIELFLPDGNDSGQMILNQLDKDTYAYANYKYDNKHSVLYINGVQKYKGNVE
ncbi:hypothetical protein [Epilithonimonas arachidiradicis]|uniref:Uncharacterized protein n=1 Tax=Epilithonimonas arachidiradicis TaxID=1617282 RepID=A0A420D967_9FLAO|nr:hypothetical protein [Epilithonimonas arachidiradicis]RKE87273.1 hypothetical protein BXY58_2154 [Epilithonimonas arachidiradicis]GGG59649.1 hypothetical protein GCM10007332_21650 [Epilithonimonas arachidiradicis]